MVWFVLLVLLVLLAFLLVRIFKHGSGDCATNGSKNAMIHFVATVSPSSASG